MKESDNVQRVHMKDIRNGNTTYIRPMVDSSCVIGLSDTFNDVQGSISELSKIQKELNQKIEKERQIQKKKNWIARSRKRGK